MTLPLPEVVTMGESMGLFFAPLGLPLVAGPAFHLSFGGAESNVAIGLARLGHEAMWVGRLGDDEIGRYIERELRGEGVRTRALTGPTHTGLMVRSQRGFDRTSVQYARTGSAGSQLSADDLPLPEIRSARIVHLTGITAALGPEPHRALLAAARTARDAGVTVSLDLNYRSTLWGAEDAGPALRELVELSDIVLATADEAQVLLGDHHSAADRHATDTGYAERIAALGPSEVIVKRGAAGAFSRVDGTVFEQNITRVSERDPVGAGDAFAAGYLHGVLVASPPQVRLDFAGRVAAHSVTVSGDWEGLPRLSDLAVGGPDILR